MYRLCIHTKPITIILDQFIKQIRAYFTYLTTCTTLQIHPNHSSISKWPVQVIWWKFLYLVSCASITNNQNITSVYSRRITPSISLSWPLPVGLVFLGKKKKKYNGTKAYAIAQPKQGKAFFTWLLSTDNGWTTEITMETLHYKRKRVQLIEESKKVKRECYRNRSKQEWMDGHLLKGFSLIDQYVGTPGYLLIWPSVLLPFHRTEISVSESSWDSNGCFLLG